MSYLLLIMSSIGIAVLAYALFHCIKLKKPILLSLIVGILAAGIIFFITPPVYNPIDTSRILVGTSGDFPPFTYVENNKAIGFDIDLIEEIGKRLHKTIEIKNMPFSTLLPTLQLGNIHVIAAGLTATPERARHVLFSTPYLEGNPLVIVSMSKAPVKTIEELTHKEVMVNEGYTADLYLSKLSGPVIKRLKTPAQAFLALKTGRAHAFVTAQNTLKPFFEQYGSQEFIVSAIPGTDENSSLAIAPQYPELLQEIQKVLDDLKQESFLQSLKTKWGLE